MHDFTVTHEMYVEEFRQINMSMTERQIRELDKDSLSHDVYEDAVNCILFWASVDGKISREEYDRLSRIYL